MPETKMLLNNRILCVDDEKNIVQAYVDFLAPAATGTPKKSSRGASAPVSQNAADEYQILTALSGEEALRVVKSELAAGRRIAGGFFDVKMDGGIDGIQAIQEIWKLDPEFHCTIVTAYQDRSVQDINQLFGSRFKDQWDYVNKPFTQGEVVQKARQMVAAWNRKRGLESALSQLKAAQDQLIAAERMAAIGQVARGVGHEFGNILQRIVGKADLTLRESDPAKVQANLRIVLDAAEHAAVIVRNLQSFSKGGGSKGLVDIGAVIGNTLALMSHDLAKSSVEFVDKRQTCPKVKADAIELQQVLMNLAINALHAMPKGGKLEMGCLEKDGAVWAWVRDTGTGIPSEILPKIFEYAFTTKGDKGSGLGLSISKKIVEEHGGAMTLESEVGKGTTFYIRLPKAVV